MRKIEKFNWMTSTWKECGPLDIKEFDLIRMFELDGVSVIADGQSMFIALSDSTLKGFEAMW